MLVLSLNTAVTCEKPLRDSERVYSSPGVPASAVSMRKVTCFSISTGDSAGARVSICTWLLVMSGTASIGMRVSDHAPRTDAARQVSTTNHRRRIENSMMRLIMALVSVLGFGLAQFGLEGECVADGDGFSGKQTGNDLNGAVILAANGHRADLETVLVADECHAFALDRLQRGFRNHHLGIVFGQRDLRGHEAARSKGMIGIAERRHYARRTGISIEERAYEYDPRRHPLPRSAEGNGDLPPFPDGRQVGKRHREIDPQF